MVVRRGGDEEIEVAVAVRVPGRDPGGTSEIPARLVADPAAVPGGAVARVEEHLVAVLGGGREVEVAVGVEVGDLDLAGAVGGAVDDAPLPGPGRRLLVPADAVGGRGGGGEVEVAVGVDVAGRDRARAREG